MSLSKRENEGERTEERKKEKKGERTDMGETVKKCYAAMYKNPLRRLGWTT